MTWPPSDRPTDRERRFVMTYEEFLAWSGEDAHAEWVDGMVTWFVPRWTRDAEVHGFVLMLLDGFARLTDQGQVLMAPVEMRLSPRSSRSPDIMFIAREHRDRVTELRVEGPADLVVEFISDDSVRRDRVEKFAEYRAAGIPEYWVLDARLGHEQTDFFQLAPAGTYEPILPDAAGRYHSRVLTGFWLRPDWLRQDPLPFVLDYLVEIAPALMTAKLRRLVQGQTPAER